MDVKLYGVDLVKDAPALYYCDERRQICRISDQDYIPQLLTLCKQERVDLLVPTIDTDLLLLAEHKAAFEKMGTKVFISAKHRIAICRDKRFTADFYATCGVDSPEPVDQVEDYTGGFPAFIKPLDGSSSIDAYRAESRGELLLLSSRIQGYIIQPFIAGKEYTVDIFCDFDGNPIYVTPRERIAVRSGEVLKTKIVQDNRIITESLRVIERFEPCGPITLQLIREEATGRDYFIEINPRFGGGAPLSMMAGADAAKATLRLLSGETLAFQPGAAKDGAVYSRFDQSVCICAGGSSRKEILSITDVEPLLKGKKAVIFDLDDTLYGEKEYVKSGYAAVAQVLTGIEHVQEKLWQAFLEHKPAIDAVLVQEGITDTVLKEKCLEVYRLHTPDIHLYPGVKQMLEKLRASGIRLGIITDGRPEGQRKKMDALGLRELVDQIIITDELGSTEYRKPHTKAFCLMAELLSIPFEQMCYVGDNPAKDFTAPELLGMKAIYFKNKDGLYS